MKTTITSASLDRNMDSSPISGVLLYSEEGNQPVRSIPVGTSFVYIMLMERGVITLRTDETNYTLHAGDMFVLIHNRGTAVIERSNNYHARVALLSREYIEYMHIPNVYRMFLSLRRNPVLHLDREARERVRNCFDLVRSMLHSTDNIYRQHTVYYALKAYIFIVAHLSQTDNQRTPSRDEDITMRFLDLLEEYYTREHTVAFYAEQLHLAPKYLSSCIKNVTGHPAIDRIAERLLTQAEKLLRRPELSISEICYHLGFAGPSAFGKFFRTHTGIGPREWRQQNM